MRLFKIDPKTRLVNLDEEWISTVKEFADIIKRNGKDHDKSIAEFTFLFHYCDYRSKFVNFTEKDKIEKCLKNSGMKLPEGGIEADVYLYSAILQYDLLQQSPALNALKEVRETLQTCLKFVRKLRTVIDAQIDNLEDIAIQTEPEEKGKFKKKSPIDILSEAVAALMKMAVEIPKTIEKIKDLEKKVKEELADEESLRGNAQLGVREQGDNQAGKPKGSAIFD